MNITKEYLFKTISILEKYQDEIDIAFYLDRAFKTLKDTYPKYLREETFKKAVCYLTMIDICIAYPDIASNIGINMGGINEAHIDNVTYKSGLDLNNIQNLFYPYGLLYMQCIKSMFALGKVITTYKTDMIGLDC